MANDDLIIVAIRHGALAGGLRHHAARDERLARGFTRAAELQSRRAAGALNAWIAARADPDDGDR